MKNNQGFTLIELVVVIVILGILAASAAPKFIDLTSDARIATLEGMKGALKSGSDMVYMKALIKGQTVGAGAIRAGAVGMRLHSGYPISNWLTSMRYILGLDSVQNIAQRNTVCDSEWCGKGGQYSLPSGITTTAPIQIGKVYPKGYSYNDECGVYYINNLNGTKPEINIETNDC